MPLTTMRAHGNTFVPERLAGDGLMEQVDGRPWTDVVGFARGWGKTFRVAQGRGNPSHSNWFHVSIPTPAMLADRPQYLENFYVFFSSDSRDTGQENTGWVTRIHAWDGSARIAEAGPFPTNFSGDWKNPRTLDTGLERLSNTFAPRQRTDPTKRIQMFTALSLSIAVAGIPGSANITFHSAGATFTDAP